MKPLLMLILALSMLSGCTDPKAANERKTEVKQKVIASITAKNMEKYNYFKTVKRKTIMQEQFIRQVEQYMEYKYQKTRTEYQQKFIERINEILDDLSC